MNDAGNNRDTSIQREPFNFIRSGRYFSDSGNIYYRSDEGLYWVSTPLYITHANNLYFHSTTLLPQDSSRRTYGFSLRCLVPLAFLLFLAQQLPTYSGTKSYQNLLVEVYGGTNTGWSSLENGHIDTLFHNLPINLARSGYYQYSNGNIYEYSNRGYFWGLQIYSASEARSLLFYSMLLHPGGAYSKGFGHTIRCLVR